MGKLGLIIFGIRSPLVVEYEETLARLGIEVSAAVSVSGVPRLMARRQIIELADFHPAEGAMFISSAFTPKRRAELVACGRALGMRLASALIDPHAAVARSARIGDGSFINAGAVIGGVTMIGENVLVNRATSIGHHCLIEDNVSFGPGATLAGNIRVGDGAMIGAGAVILPDIRIGAGAIVAAGSLVRQNVPDETFVAGNPAIERSFDPAKSWLNVEDSE